MTANNKCSKRRLHFVFYSVDEINDYEAAPVASFDPTSQERRRLYTLYQPNGINQNVSSTNTVIQNDAEEQFGAYMQQGVHEDSLISNINMKSIMVNLSLD